MRSGFENLGVTSDRLDGSRSNDGDANGSVDGRVDGSVDASVDASQSDAGADASLTDGSRFSRFSIEVQVQALRKAIAIASTLADDSSGVFDLTPEYRIGAQPWTLATPAAGSAALTGVTASPTGTTITFIWDSLPDTGPFDVAGVLFRITAVAQEGGASETRSIAFDVANSVSVAASLNAACASHPEGGVSCWGSDRYGALGDGDSDTAPLPVSVQGVDDAWRVALSAGYYSGFGCALARSGTIDCWGSNDRGQLGDGSVVPRNAAAAVAGIGDAVALALGLEFACALRVGGQVACWGAGSGGQLGDGRNSDSALPVAVLGIGAAHKVVTSNYASHACALVDSALWCWGNNGSGQLGDGTRTGAASPVATAPGSSWVDAAVGHNFSCALRSDGTVWCWGDNDCDQLGSDVVTDSLVPVQIAGVSGAIAVAAGASNACAILQDRSLWCWGSGAYNNLLDDRLLNSGAPVALTELGPVAEVSMGGYTHGGPQTTLCAVKMSGEVACWGNNQQGQHGTGASSQQRTAIEVPAFDGATSIAIGPSFTCAAVNGEVRCAGSNVQGTLGDGTLLAREYPAPVVGVTGARSVAAGTSWTPHGTHACALLQDGSVSCWGGNSSGQLGDRTPVDAQPTPTAVQGIAGATQIEVGVSYSCAVLADQTARCWGGNYDGQLGDGTFSGSLLPVEPMGLGPVTKLATYYRHVCALRVDGGIRCWGECDYGESGNGATGMFNTPQEVLGIDGALDVDAGGEHACAILADRSVACWGADNSGQLGNGTGTTSHLPSAVVGLTDALALALGFYHSCALKLDGTVWCWGGNSFGELGDPAAWGASSPIPVPGVSDGVAIYAGGNSTFVVTGSGAVLAFGDNQFGQLGIGHGHLRPQLVAGLP